MILSKDIIQDAFDRRLWKAFHGREEIASSQLKVGTNSIDVTLSKFFICPIANLGTGYIDLRDTETLRTVPMVEKSELHIRPGEFYLGCTNERFETDMSLRVNFEETYWVQMCHGRSTLARCGIMIHCVAGFGDYGFSGHWTLEIANVGNSPVLLREGDRVAQIAFERILSHRGAGPKHYIGEYNNKVAVPGMPSLGTNRV